MKVMFCIGSGDRQYDLATLSSEILEQNASDIGSLEFIGVRTKDLNKFRWSLFTGLTKITISDSDVQDFTYQSSVQLPLVTAIILKNSTMDLPSTWTFQQMCPQVSREEMSEEIIDFRTDGESSSTDSIGSSFRVSPEDDSHDADADIEDYLGDRAIAKSFHSASLPPVYPQKKDTHSQVRIKGIGMFNPEEFYNKQQTKVSKHLEEGQATSSKKKST